MNKSFIDRINSDLVESQINWKLAILIIPFAFFTYLFHEFGHWLGGEIFGNDMVLGLNNCSPKSGYFLEESHELWSAIGGPAFTIIQALIFLGISYKTKSIYAYFLVFFAAFSCFFSLFFGGIDLQDEAGIAYLLNTNKYLVASIVLLILFLIVWRSSRIMRLNIKSIGYFTVLSTIAILIVIGLSKLI